MSVDWSKVEHSQLERYKRMFPVDWLEYTIREANCKSSERALNELRNKQISTPTVSPAPDRKQQHVRAQPNNQKKVLVRKS